MSIKKHIKRLLPPALFATAQMANRRARLFSWRLRHPGNSHACPLCQNTFGAFLPNRNPYAIAAEADIISGQSIRNHNCPYCFAFDRDRSLYFYFRDNVSFTGKKVLHFAPEASLLKLISAAGTAEYVSGDIDPKTYYAISKSVRYMDMLAIDYPEGYFDIAICNHILEHIPEDTSAMKEIFRVLKPGGIAVLLVPIGAKLKYTLEDYSKTTDEQRAHAFGQSDHVRIYAEADYLSRLRSIGFDVKVEKVKLADAEIEKFGINPRESLYIAHKPLKK